MVILIYCFPVLYDHCFEVFVSFVWSFTGFYTKDEPLNHPLIKEAVDSDVKRRVMGGQTFQLVACIAGA